MVDVPPIPAGLVLPPQELQLRARLLGEGGPLASAMRAIEARAWRDESWLATCWLWVQCLVVVRGFRGSTTVADYVEAAARFMGWAEELQLDFRQLSVRELDDWQKWLYVRRRLSASARRSALMAVRSLYSYLATRGDGVDVTKGYKAPKRVITQAKKYSGAQLKALFVAVKQGATELIVQRDRALLLLLLASGLRREEVTALRVDQLDLASERKGQVHVFGKGSKERTVPIEGPVVRELLAWLEARSRIPSLCTDAVFVNLSRGGRPGLSVPGGALAVKSIEDTVKRTAQRAGLSSWGVHRFRVTFATMLYDDGTDIERIRVLMGHESIETTRRYLAVSNRMNRYTLKAHRQYAALGTVPDDMPRWAQELERKRHGSSVLPPG
jgi:site-specific recombinase XerD